MPQARFLPSFAGGVLSPGLHGRIDTAKYDVGLKVGRNVFVQVHGGVSNRAGTEYVGEVTDHAVPHRLIPFRRDSGTNVALLFGPSVMKVIDGGAFVQSGGTDYAISTPFTVTQGLQADYVQSVDTMWFAHQGLRPRKLQRSGPTSWAWSSIALDPGASGVTGLSGAPASAGSTVYAYRVTAVRDGVESLPSAAFSFSGASLDDAGARNTLTWTGTADEFNVYRERNGVYGYIGFTEGNTFTDDNISPDLTQTPPVASKVLNAAGAYPAVVTLFQQRLVFANSLNSPETIWASRIGDYENFSRSRILRDDDRIELDLTGASLNAVRALLPLRELLAFTSSGEFSITGPQGALLASNPIQTQQGYSGSTWVKPLVVDDTALFVDSSGRTVRDLRYAFEQDGYAGNDLTVFSSHFFDGRQIAGWDFAKSPHALVWVHLDDGRLLSLTYKREHQVWAWCEHDVGGAVESLAVVREGRDDVPYLIVRRTIGGQVRRYVERIRPRDFAAAEDAYFVDCGRTYRGAATTTLGGLGHLEGQTVTALADGNVVPSLVVSGGQVTLPRAASVVHVGLPYVAEIETLPPALEIEGIGSARGRPQKASAVYLQLEKTRGIEVAGAGRQFAEIVQTGGNLASPIALTTGMVKQPLFSDWNRDGTIVVRQRHPLPMTILGISPELSVGRTG